MSQLPRIAVEQTQQALYQEFLTELHHSGFSGEIESAYGKRLIAATDNSVYQQLPQAIVYPTNAEDVSKVGALLAESRFETIKTSPRGGGTGTNGQSLTSGIVVDLSRHMNRVLEINVEEGWVRVEAGLVKDQLNDALRPHGFFFSPDLSTSNRATLGGMINTDASGQGSLVYGKTSDHVLGLTTVTVGGDVLETAPVSLQQAQQHAQQTTKLGRIYQQVLASCVEHRQAIEAKFPPLNRFLTGYDLAHAYDPAQQSIDVSRLITGSEGTLGFVVEAKLNITPIPNQRVLVNVKYLDFQAALRHAPFLVKANATSVETIDSNVLNLAKQDIIWHSVEPHLSEVDGQTMNGINMVEFTGVDKAEIDAKVNALTAELDKQAKTQQQGVIGYQICADLESIQTIYAMRKKAVGLLGATKGRRKPVAFAEDTAVPPEQLADYILEFRQLLDDQQLHYGMFGHVDAGVLHVRPALDLTEPEDEKLLRTISDQVAALTQKYGGLMWGEHGKGYRSEYAENFFGEQLFTELRKIKAVFDPNNQVNPGKICTPLNSAETLVSVDDTKRGYYDRQIPIQLRDDYSNAMSCNGNGLCFNYDPRSPMCPSYRVSGDRRFSPKGRATLMREWLRLTNANGYDASGWPLQNSKTAVTAPDKGDDDFNHEVKEAMDTCLACKACTNQCPVNVDVPTFRAKFLAHYHSRYKRPLKDFLVKSVEQTAPLMAKFPKLSNALTHNPLSKAVMRHVFGYVDAPKLSVPNLQQRWQRRGFAELDVEAIEQLGTEEHGRLVVVVQDPFTSFYEAEVVESFAVLANKLGFTPVLLPFKGNGKAQHVKGFLHEFKETAERVAKSLRRIHQLGVAMVGVDASTVLCYRDEYRQVLSAEQANFHVATVDEWLNDAVKGREPETAFHRQYQLLSHCTEQSLTPGSSKQWQTIFAAFGLSLTVVKTGCCGMAGTYGHEQQNQTNSHALFAMSWQQPIDQYGASGVVATGFSCRSQVKRIEKKRVKHPLEILAETAR
ncbi:hypothetical protein CWI84_00815 [Idiomarina tyrosinivorans]|uniref:D-2-hydroxyglutarate dehydrogenase n=1 Tax=Idiomarina tyrosinivorans TaxID=1445662 RepID=A0A432ZU19_9GAMM|nr:FAD-binding and (Fe-S)-binding domain-containing protein [Idiomarina tyrosinivorans]RUO81332.1 hypothetical protein CWI84_00815 [Idiomarina tyrosinivorans]